MRLTRVIGALVVPILASVGGVPVAHAGSSPCERLAGSYYGDWFNDTFDSDGATFIDMQLSGRTANFRVDVDGSAFGMLDPPEMAVVGVVDGAGANISVNQTMVGAFGDISGTIDCSSGDIDFTLTMPSGFMQVDITGFFQGTGFRLDYSIPVMMLTAITGTLVMDMAGTPASDFDDLDENWFTSDNAGPTVMHFPSAGNPGAFLQIPERDASVAYKLVAPSIFRGDLSAFDGGLVSFDASVFPILPVDNQGFGTVTLSGPGGTASLDLVTGSLPVLSFANFSGRLDASTFGVTQQQWTAILSDVRRLTIEFDAYDGASETTSVDNVVILPLPGATAPVAVATLAACLAWRRSRRAS
jgi:hypothetical protein